MAWQLSAARVSVQLGTLTVLLHWSTALLCLCRAQPGGGTELGVAVALRGPILCQARADCELPGESPSWKAEGWGHEGSAGVPCLLCPQVQWLEQQVAKRRTKRDVFMEPTDPKFPQQWYLVSVW